VTSVTVLRADGAAVVAFAEPVLSEAVLAELESCLDLLARDGGRTPVVLRSTHPTIFLAGAHLAEIAALDAARCTAYAGRGRAVLDRLAAHPAPTVAAVHGSCSGGGFDLALACDRIVAADAATFSHPGVRRGLVTGWGGTVRLPAVAGAALAGRAMIAGAPISGRELAARGIAVAADGDVVAAARAVAARLAAVPHTRLLLWRAFRASRSRWPAAARAIIGSAAVP
jgi:enoyl-CoA hydratase/carnithine racemase